MKKQSILFVLTIAFFCVAFAYYFKFSDLKYELKQKSLSNDSLQFRYDSVQDVLFSTEVELGRYQVTLENMDTVTKKKFEDYLYSQTE